MSECSVCDYIKMTVGIWINVVYMILLKREIVYVWMLNI